MTNRITQTELERIVVAINKGTGNPCDPYKLNPETGKHESQAGNYQVPYAEIERLAASLEV